jgi:hypothetical protein
MFYFSNSKSRKYVSCILSCSSILYKTLASSSKLLGIARSVQSAKIKRTHVETPYTYGILDLTVSVTITLQVMGN